MDSSLSSSFRDTCWKLDKIRPAVHNDPVANPAAVVNLVNHAYTRAEQGLVRPHYYSDCHKPCVVRLTLYQAEELIKGGELLVLTGRQETLSHKENDPAAPQDEERKAEKAETTAKLLGCCTVQKLDETVGEWGCLAVHTDYQGYGLGLLLVQAAEARLRNQYKCRILQIQFLDFDHPDDNDKLIQTTAYRHKQRLRAWYIKKLGYTAVPSEAQFFGVNAPFGDSSHMYFDAAATLTPLRKDCKESSA